MKKAYIEIMELTDEEFAKVKNTKNAYEALKSIIPTAVGYTTCFFHGGKIWHTDTNYDSNDFDCKLQVLHHNVGVVVKELPVVEKTIEVQKPGMFTESLLLKAISAASIGYPKAGE